MQNCIAAIYEILIIHQYMGLKLKLSPFSLHYELCLPDKWGKIKKSLQYDSVSPQNVSQDQISASTDLDFQIHRVSWEN